MAKSRFTPFHLSSAQAGTYTRANTLPGSPERAAVYRSEYLAREARGVAEGLSKGAAHGHAKLGEASAKDMGIVKRSPELATLDQLRRVAFAHAKLVLVESPRFDADRTKSRIQQQIDPGVLIGMATMTYSEWAAQASSPLEGNPYFYR